MKLLDKLPKEYRNNKETLAHFILMQYLKSIGIEEDQALGISGILKTEENITAMNWYIHDNRSKGISREEIANQILRIVQPWE
jgi:hypothetical protein